jgi:acetylornithine deacetylase
MSTAAHEAQDEVLAAITPSILAADVARMVRAPSPTGAERPAVQELAAIAEEHGLPARIDVHDLPALRGLAGCPGEGAARDELLGLTATLGGRGPRRLCLNGHVDVVAPGGTPWERPPFAGEVVLQAVSSGEDGGLGTFAALELDDGFDACLIPEATAFDVVSAHGGALTFFGTVRGVSAHAAVRLQGVSAIDRYMSVHAALAEHERAVNAAVADPLMARLELPYPLLVGRLSAGHGSSQVPDVLEFVDDPFVALVHAAAREQCSPESSVSGVSYGADMRHFCLRGIPCVMLGAPGFERAHAADEFVSIDDLVRVARAIAVTILRFGS